MIAAILAGLTFLGQLLAFGMRVWDAKHEKDIETKKQKTEILQSGIKGVIEHDKAALTKAFDDFNNLS